MNLEEFYNNIETPLNETGIKAIIDLYCLEGNLYNNIIDFIHNPYVLPSGKEYDEYYLYMFNTWKNKITNMSRNAFKVLREKGKVENDFIILRKYLNELEEPKSAYEVKEIMNKNYEDDVLKKAFQKYGWNTYCENENWIYILSSYANATYEDKFNLEDRLYISASSPELYKMLYLFTKKCNEKQVPYFYAFTPNCGRDENIVIYSSHDMLDDYIRIFKEIKEQNSDVVEKLNPPPLLTSPIMDFIGYGSHPKTNYNKQEPESYNSIRSKLLTVAITRGIIKYCLMNLNTSVMLNEKEMSLKQALASFIADELIKDMRKVFLEHEEKNFSLYAKSNKEINNQITDNELGYNLNDLENNPERLISLIVNTLDQTLRDTYEGMENTIKIGVKYGRKVDLKKNHIINALKNVIEDIAKEDYKFIELIKKEIISLSRTYGVDANKFCFDVRDIVDFKEINNPNKIKTEKDVESFNDKLNKMISKDKVEYEKVDFETFKKIIGLKSNDKPLPYIDITCSSFLKEKVYPSLPDKGLIIDKNLNYIKLVDYVKNLFRGDCINKHKLNYNEYILENIRYNVGLIKVVDNEQEIEIKCDEIIKYIPEEYLNIKIERQDGTTILSRDLIQKEYTRFIPYDGYMKSKDGRKVSAAKFIMNVLKSKVLEKTKGNLVKLISETITYNNGYVDISPLTVDSETEELNRQKEVLNKNTII